MLGPQIAISRFQSRTVLGNKQTESKAGPFQSRMLETTAYFKLGLGPSRSNAREHRLFSFRPGPLQGRMLESTVYFNLGLGPSRVGPSKSEIKIPKLRKHGKNSSRKIFVPTWHKNFAWDFAQGYSAYILCTNFARELVAEISTLVSFRFVRETTKTFRLWNRFVLF